MIFFFSTNKIVKFPQGSCLLIANHLGEKGVKSWAISKSLPHDLSLLGLGNHPQGLASALLLTRAWALLPRNSPSPESFWRLISQSLNSSAWYQTNFCSLGIFAWIHYCPKCFLSLSVSSSSSSTWEANTCDTRKGGIRDVFNS